MGPFDIWSQMQALQPPNQYGQPQPVPGAPDPAVMRQEGLDGGHGNDGNRGRRPGPPSKPRWREMDWGDRLTALGAIVGDLDPRMQGQGYRAFREEYAGRGQADLARQQAQAQLERQQAFRDAYAASLDANGNIDPAKLQRNLAPFIDDIGDIGAINSATRERAPSRYTVGGDLVEVGESGPQVIYGPGGSYRPSGNGFAWVPNGPGAAPQRRAVPPDVAARAVPINPNQAAPSGAAAPQGNVNYLAPFNMQPSSPFGPRTPPKTRGGRGSRNHGGIDYPVGIGTAVPSAADGEVIFADNLGGYGNTVKVRHPDGSVTQYSHLRSPSVRVGDRIAAGAPVGESGDTGNVSGPHLHFGAYDAQGRPIDPATRYRR